MDHVTLSLAVGAVAGALVAIPMIFQRSSARSCFSAFFVYLFAAVLVFHGRLPYLPWWAQGMAVVMMLTVPLLFAFSGKYISETTEIERAELFSEGSARSICRTAAYSGRRSVA